MPSALASQFLRAQDYYKVFSRFLMEGNREFWTSVLAPQSVEGIHLSGPGCTCAGCKVRIRREAWINERTVPAERHDQVVRAKASHFRGNTFDRKVTARPKSRADISRISDYRQMTFIELALEFTTGEKDRKR